jgi:hypothetical protein
MSDFKVDQIVTVRSTGENRRIVEIEGIRARCATLDDKMFDWFAFADLRHV